MVSLRAEVKMRKLNQNKALVLFSGGQDSSIALGWALDRFEAVETIGFDYGQRHFIELGARKAVVRELRQSFAPAQKLGRDHVVGANGLNDIGDTAMTAEHDIVIGEDELPTTFVPGRNLLFLTFAAGLAYRLGVGTLVAGMCETDFSGYPDCRETALSAQMKAICLGMDTDMHLETPLMHITKAESWRMAERLGGEEFVGLVNEHSHSCYRGIRSTRYEWGYGCDDCPACELRAKGWAEYSSA